MINDNEDLPIAYEIEINECNNLTNVITINEEQIIPYNNLVVAQQEWVPINNRDSNKKCLNKHKLIIISRIIKIILFIMMLILFIAIFK